LVLEVGDGKTTTTTISAVSNERPLFMIKPSTRPIAD